MEKKMNQFYSRREFIKKNALSCAGGYSFLYFHMNLGWDGRDDAWYGFTHNGGYSNYREDFYIKKP